MYCNHSFNIGDIVKVKGSDVEMEITTLGGKKASFDDSEKYNGIVTCKWYEDGLDDYKDFDVNELELVRSSQGVSVEKRRGFFLLILCLLFGISSTNAAVKIDGIWYEVIAKIKKAEVIASTDGTMYTGDMVIPEKITCDGIEYSVTSIGNSAFSHCSITSIAIPNSVTSIGDYAFSSCSITSIAIPNSVTSIGHYAFSSCFKLTSIIIPNNVTFIGMGAFSGCSNLSSINIPNSITSISSEAFSGCSSLTSITIPNSVTLIGSGAFERCTGLKEVYINDLAAWCDISFYDYSRFSESNPLRYAESLYVNGEEVRTLIIPNSVTSIRQHAFSGCTCLTSVTIPNSVTNIGSGAFSDCTGLTSVTIPNSVTSIGNSVFYGCTGLTSVTIGNSVTSIGIQAFSGCSELADVYCLVEECPHSSADAFSNSYIEYATLHVPEVAINDYKIKKPWSDFGIIKTLDGEEIEVKKCALPTISYQGGKLMFGCETEGVDFVSEMACEDIKKHYDAEVALSATYTVSVYAMMTGYENSEIATATLCWMTCNHEQEEEDGVINIPSTAVLIQTMNGTLTIQGLEEGTAVGVYSASGKEVTNGIAEEDATVTLDTDLQKGDIAVVKMGAKSVKVMMK